MNSYGSNIYIYNVYMIYIMDIYIPNNPLKKTFVSKSYSNAHEKTFFS